MVETDDESSGSDVMGDSPQQHEAPTTTPTPTPTPTPTRSPSPPRAQSPPISAGQTNVTSADVASGSAPPPPPPHVPNSMESTGGAGRGVIEEEANKISWSYVAGEIFKCQEEMSVAIKDLEEIRNVREILLLKLINGN